MKRTNAPLNLSPSNRPMTADSGAPKNDETKSERSPAPAVQDARPPPRTDTADTALKDLKKGVKAVSFLSRLMGSSKKHQTDEDALEDEADEDDDRPEGNDAAVFTEPVENMGYSPQRPQPPAYIKVRSKYKKSRDFDHLFLAQELQCRKKRKLERQYSSNKLRRKSSATPEANTVWAMEFSKDGRHLAAAGTDMIVRVWAVLASPEDRQKHERQEASENEEKGGDAHAEHLSAPVFQSTPVREYEGHTSTVLDLSWSKNNFLLSSSMDKTVRLWHVSRPECLCTFKHNDFVPSISFHPKDDRFFLAGSLDSKLRLWSIPDKSVAYAVQVPDMITAVGFTPDGKYSMAGCLGGLCMFYETEGLKYQTQIHVRSTRGQNAKGSKITGIQAHQTSRGEYKLLITSNDSRIRLYNFRDKSLELKFKGNENNCSQIRASISDCGRYVVCGSEDRKVYLWSLKVAEGDKRDKRPVEMFEAHDTITTAVCLAPAKTRQLLGRSEDPIYDLCNPPPVTLMSLAEKADSHNSSKAPTENGSVRPTPASPDAKFDKPQPSPAFFARSTHNGGNIIVTADYTGKIKVFRQDCAWSKRKQDDWDKASIFSKRNGRASRAGSLATKASHPSLREGRPSSSAQAPSDRILSWRQGIASSSHIAGNRSSSKHTSRSVSPSKSLDQRPKATRQASDDALARSGAEQKTSAAPNGNGKSDSPIALRLNNSHDDNPLLIQNGQSNLFWDTTRWKEQAENMRKAREDGHHHHHHHHHPLTPVRSADESVTQPPAPSHEQNIDPNHLAVVRPGMNTAGSASYTTRAGSYVSRLSDDRSTTSGEEGELEQFDDAREGPED
jgi:WD repeat-containing protein 44